MCNLRPDCGQLGLCKEQEDKVCRGMQAADSDTGRASTLWTPVVA